MIRIGFVGYETNYQGGINYLKNLFYAMKKLNHKELEIVVFVGKKDDYQANEYQKSVRVIRTSVLDRYSIAWFVNKVSYKLFGHPLILSCLLKKYNVDVLSHSYFTSRFFKVKTINWIPDFQILHFPDLWGKDDIEKWRQSLSDLALNADKIILSSYDAFKDFMTCLPQYEHKVEVLQFVSQPSKPLSPMSLEGLQSKYNFSGDFFYLPNQFWQHKNHKVVFESCLILKQKNINITIVCSGLMSDFRSKDNQYISELMSFIKDNGLEENIKILGLIDYSDVLSLMKMSLAVINPSLFEGWSSTVEESKSMGKKIVLSDIPVHIEQNPAFSFYFDRHSAIDLANILQNLWLSKDKNIAYDDPSLEQRTREFAEKYKNIVHELF